jgi:hypothetical protein
LLALERAHARPIAGSFHSGTSRRRRISREPARRSGSMSASAIGRKPCSRATPFTTERNHGKLSASVPSRSKMTSETIGGVLCMGLFFKNFPGARSGFRSLKHS